MINYNDLKKLIKESVHIILEKQEESGKCESCESNEAESGEKKAKHVSSSKGKGKKLTWVTSNKKPDPLYHLKKSSIGKTKKKKSADGHDVEKSVENLNVKSDEKKDEEYHAQENFKFNKMAATHDAHNKKEKNTYNKKLKENKFSLLQLLKEADENQEYDSDKMKKLRNWAGQSNLRNYIDASDYHLCFGDNAIKQRDARLSIDLIIKLVEELYDILENEWKESAYNIKHLKRFTISAFDREESARRYSNSNTLVICLNDNANWDRIDSLLPVSDDLKLLFKKLNKEEDFRNSLNNWGDLWDLILGEIMNIQKINVKSDGESCADSLSGVDCYDLINFIREKDNVIGKLERVKEYAGKRAGVGEDDERIKFLLKRLKTNTDINGNTLSEEEREEIKQKILKARKEKEGWLSYGKRMLSGEKLKVNYDEDEPNEFQSARQLTKNEY